MDDCKHEFVEAKVSCEPEGYSFVGVLMICKHCHQPEVFINLEAQLAAEKADHNETKTELDAADSLLQECRRGAELVNAELQELRQENMRINAADTLRELLRGSHGVSIQAPAKHMVKILDALDAFDSLVERGQGDAI